MDTDFLGDYSDLQEILGGEWNHRAARSRCRLAGHFPALPASGVQGKAGPTGL